MAEAKKKELSKDIRELVVALAIANGHSRPDEYADKVQAAFAGELIVKPDPVEEVEEIVEGSGEFPDNGA